jgi:nuclear pore complex protein Nup188
MDTFTQILPHGFSNYDVDDEDSDFSKVRLNSDLLVFAPRKIGVFEDEYSSRGGIIIPAGTIGEITSTGGIRPVVAWQYQYNVFPVLGRVLEHALIGNGVDPGPSHAAGGSSEAVTEIIGLLSILVASGAGTPVPDDVSPTRILEEASDLLGRSRDVVSIVFDLLESGLQAAQSAPNSGKSTDFIVAAVQFVDALVPILPGRVWPYLARSTILEQNGRGGAFYGILSAVEVVRGDYEFAINCLKLYEDLVEEAIRSSVVNMGGSKSVALASVAPASINRSGVSVGVQRDILAAWTRVAVDVFESYHGWKYVNQEQKLEIGKYHYSKDKRPILTILIARTTNFKDIYEYPFYHLWCR